MTGYSRTEPAAWQARELESMSVAQIRELAGRLGYSISRRKKTELIQEFIKEQKLHDQRY